MDRVLQVVGTAWDKADAYSKSKERKIEIGITGWRQELTSKILSEGGMGEDCKQP